MKMPEKKIPRDNDELMDAITDLFNSVAPETPEEVDAFLIEAGYPPDELGEKFKILAEQALEQSPYNWRNIARAMMEKDKNRYSKLESNIPQGRDNLLDAIKKMISSFPEDTQNQLRLAFRNYEEQTENDLASVYMDLMFLRDYSESEEDR
jgi:hypothetical protein